MKFTIWLKSALIIIIVLIVIFFIIKTHYLSLKIKIIDPGSKICQNDDDCISVNGCDAGCWSQPPIIERPHTCATAGPSHCKCINNTCVPE